MPKWQQLLRDLHDDEEDESTKEVTIQLVITFIAFFGGLLIGAMFV